MQTVLGSNGPIGQELVKELYKSFTKDLRLVSRNPKKINESDQLMSADLLNFNETNKAIAGSEIVYFTVGLPMNSQIWTDQFPTIVKNVIDACKLHHSKLVFFDNTYMYAKNDNIQYENSPFEPKGEKSEVRARVANMVLDAINSKQLQGVICRAPEFYGPNNTVSITNTMIFKNIQNNKPIKVPISDSVLRTLIWTPDASRAMALIGNTEDAYDQTWHLPCDDSMSYKDMITSSETIENKKFNYSVIKMWQFKLASYFSTYSKELQELLPRYQKDNIFNSDKFKKRFPDFKVTSYKSGISQILTSKKGD